MGKSKYKKLNEEDRMIIQACLHRKFSISQIAKRLNVHKSTISRELKRNCIVKKGLDNIECPTLNKILVCNICSKKGFCISTKKYYNYKHAITLTQNRNVEARSIPKLKMKHLKIIDDIVTNGVLLGQSLHHIYISNPELEEICCERTIRRLVYRGNLSIRPHQLRKYVVYKREYLKEPREFRLRDIRALIGRTYRDYNRYCNNHELDNVVHYDSLIGKRDDKQAILTITFVKYNFQFGLLIQKSNPASVNKELKKLFKHLGDDLVKKVFPINLCDNGIEFSYFHKIETNNQGEVLIKTFYTNPYQATNKAQAERNHGLVRYFLPKGKSLDNLDQETVNMMFSHLNSYVREAKGNKTPYDLVKAKFGVELLYKLNIARIPNKKVRLLPLV